MSKDFPLSDAKAVFAKNDLTGLAEYQGNLEAMVPAACKLKIKGKPVALQPDFAKVIHSVPYKHSIQSDTPGSGMLTITALHSDQLTQKLKVMGQKVIKVGSEFKALYTHAPATKIPGPPPPPIPDPPPHNCKGTFKTGNDKLKTK